MARWASVHNSENCHDHISCELYIFLGMDKDGFVSLEMINMDFDSCMIDKLDNEADTFEECNTDIFTGTELSV